MPAVAELLAEAGVAHAQPRALLAPAGADASIVAPLQRLMALVGKTVSPNEQCVDRVRHQLNAPAAVEWTLLWECAANRESDTSPDAVVG